MICPRCQYRGRPGFVLFYTGPNEYVWIPCPDCGGTQRAHCCEGDNACNDKEEK